MTMETLAAALNGREYRKEMTKIEESEAKAAGLVVIFGASDDLVELRGAIFDEVGAWNGTDFRIDSQGLRQSWEEIDKDEEDDAAAYFKRKAIPSYQIEAKWDCDGYSWVISADVTCATFDILENGEKFCRGIVLQMPAKAT